LFTQFNVWRDVWAQGNAVRKGGRGKAEERAHLCKRGLGGSHQCADGSGLGRGEPGSSQRWPLTGPGTMGTNQNTGNSI